MSSIYNNNYFLSDKVKVFPCAYRNNTYDATARLNTEYNFTHLPHMVDKASYIIEFDNEKLICVINGYYFEIELDADAGDYNKLYNSSADTTKDKYLNICVASPSGSNGENFIEGPHLCSWNSNNIEAGLDLIQATSSSSVYVFTGLQISESSSLSKEGYQCYALKLDDSAKLPINTNKIENIIKNKDGVENGTGKPISQEFTTDTLTTNKSISTPSLNVENNGSTILKAYSSGITAHRTVQIYSNLTSTSLKSTSLNIETDSTKPILKAGSKEVTIHKPTTITGANSNLTVAGTGKFGGKLTVTTGGADITGNTQIKKSSSGATDGNLTVAGTVGITGKTTIGTSSTITEIENNKIKTSEITADKINIEKASGTGSLVINKNQDKIIEIKDESNTSIFYVDTNSGETFAKKINATVEGTSDNAINAQNVTDTIKGTNITDIFGSTSNKIDRLKLRIIEPDTDATYNKPVRIVLKKDNESSTVYAVDFYLEDNNATSIVANNFIGNASTASKFWSDRTIELTGDVTGSDASKGEGWTINTKLAKDAVTTTKIKDNNVTNAKLEHNSITIGSNKVALGGSIGTSDNPFTGSIYFGGADSSSSESQNCNIVITGQHLMSDGTKFPLEIKDYSGKSLIKFTNNYGANENTSVSKQIIYAATDHDITSQGQTKGRTELFGDKICIYAQGHDSASGTIEAGTIDLSKSDDNAGLKIAKLNQIKVNGAGLKSSQLIAIDTNTNKVYLGTTDYGAIIDGNGTLNNATFEINSAKTSGDMLQINKFLYGGASSTEVFNIDCDGNVTANTYNAKSDRRLKENVIDYKPEKSILDLPIKKFDFIDGPKNQIGCIAQDLKEICPEIVNENEKGYLSIQESKLVYLLLDEVKKLKNEVEELKRN